MTQVWCAYREIVFVSLPDRDVTLSDASPSPERQPKHTLPFILPWDENLDVGADTGTPVDDGDYQVPFTFTGKLIKLTLHIEPPVLTDADKKRLQKAQQDSNMAQ